MADLHDQCVCVKFSFILGEKYNGKACSVAMPYRHLSYFLRSNVRNFSCRLWTFMLHRQKMWRKFAKSSAKTTEVSFWTLLPGYASYMEHNRQLYSKAWSCSRSQWSPCFGCSLASRNQQHAFVWQELVDEVRTDQNFFWRVVTEYETYIFYYKLWGCHFQDVREI